MTSLTYVSWTVSNSIRYIVSLGGGWVGPDGWHHNMTWSRYTDSCLSDDRHQSHRRLALVNFFSFLFGNARPHTGHQLDGQDGWDGMLSGVWRFRGPERGEGAGRLAGKPGAI